MAAKIDALRVFSPTRAADAALPFPGDLFQPQYRVTFLGVFPSMKLTGNGRHRYERHFASREEAQDAFNDEPTAYQFDRWEPETKGWVMLNVRDKV